MDGISKNKAKTHHQTRRVSDLQEIERVIVSLAYCLSHPLKDSARYINHQSLKCVHRLHNLLSPSPTKNHCDFLIPFEAKSPTSRSYPFSVLRYAFSRMRRIVRRHDVPWHHTHSLNKFTKSRTKLIIHAGSMSQSEFTTWFRKTTGASTTHSTWSYNILCKELTVLYENEDKLTSATNEQRIQLSNKLKTM